MTSSKVASPIKNTDLETMWQEIERLCLPKVNKIIERVEFRQLEQEEDEKINNFESRVRSKAKVCEYEKPCKKCACNCKTCKGDREEDEIRTQILGKVRNKKVQAELWREDNNSGDKEKSLEDILRIIRAEEATDQQQQKQAFSYLTQYL